MFPADPQATRKARRSQSIGESVTITDSPRGVREQQMSCGKLILYAQVVVGSYAAEMSRLDPGQATRTVRSCLRAARAKPGEYVIALSAASASTPVIGRHIQPIGWQPSASAAGRIYPSSRCFLVPVRCPLTGG